MASMLVLLATASSVFACTYWLYQPRTPKSLQK
ncbi:cyclic lactone autoinducer peptide [Dehalobacter sp. UNSWDHB]|nr:MULTISPECIES: cyclic lactone autoinducer peptide [unclassified Dehalobacter]